MLKYIFSVMASFVFSSIAVADGHEVKLADPAEISFVFNTLLFCIGGFLVMWMAAGFTMLEAGLVRAKNTVVICLKNVGLFSIAGVAYYLIGYNLMYAGVDGGYIGSVSIWSSGVGSDSDLVGQAYSPASDWFFSNGFCSYDCVNCFWCFGGKNINLAIFRICSYTHCYFVPYIWFMAMGWWMAK
jgi:Amt family ammonium transporter